MAESGSPEPTLYDEARRALGPAPRAPTDDPESTRAGEIAADDELAVETAGSGMLIGLAFLFFIVGSIPLLIVGWLVSLVGGGVASIGAVVLVIAWIVLPVLLAVQVRRRAHRRIRDVILAVRRSRIRPVLDVLDRLVSFLGSFGG